MKKLIVFALILFSFTSYSQVIRPNRTGIDTSLIGLLATQNAFTKYNSFAQNVGITGDLAVTGTTTINGNLNTSGHNTLGNSIADTTVITGFLKDDAKDNLFLGRNSPITYSGTIGGNIFLGKMTAGLALTTGYTNICIGNGAGIKIVGGSNNILIGTLTGGGTLAAQTKNTWIGGGAGYVSTGAENVYMGFNSGYRNGGSDNVFLGNLAGYSETSVTNNSRSIFIGKSAGENIYAAPDDIGIGYHALRNDSATGMGMNIAIGQYAMTEKRRGNYNTVVGTNAVKTLNKNVNNITAFGYNTLALWNKDTLAPALTAIGTNALSINTSGVFITAVGNAALGNSTTTGYCNAFGYATLSMYQGAYSSAFGHEAGFSWLTGNYNNLIGMYAGRYQSVGADNNYFGAYVAYGYNGMEGGGSSNQYIGNQTARFNLGSNNVMIGHNAGRNTVNYTMNGSVYLGYQAGYNDTLDNKLIIGNSITSKLIEGDFSANIVNINSVLSLTPLAAAPFSGTEVLGMIYVNTDTHIYMWNGTAWKQLDN